MPPVGYYAGLIVLFDVNVDCWIEAVVCIPRTCRRPLPKLLAAALCKDSSPFRDGPVSVTAHQIF